MTEERTVEVTVEAVGEISWPNPDGHYNDPEPIARVIDAEGWRYLVTNRQCYRNGTVIRPEIVGEKGTIGWFNCPTLMKR